MRAPIWCAAVAMTVTALASTTIAATPESAKALIARGDLQAARAMLQEELRSGRRSVEVDFLLGMIAIQQHDYREAITHFRRALVREPGSARLRLELGRAFFLARDYRGARFHFERALAGDLPPQVQANVRRFLDVIRRKQRWSYDVSVGLAPDTNINGGSSAEQALIFGLPFQLGKDAKARSGIGADANASIEFTPRISGRLRWKSGIAVQRREYNGTSFDDMIATAWSGPQWFAKGLEINVAATSFWRWYGGRRYQHALGGRIETIINSGARTTFLLGASGQDFIYPTFASESGPVWTAIAGVAHVFDPTTSVTLTVNGARQRARARDLSNLSVLISLAAIKDLRGGFTLTVAPAYALSHYDAPDALFAVRRCDRSEELKITLLNRRAAIWRFTPTITYTWLQRHSTIDLYRSRQQRIELGLTSLF